jgi:C1A family cysteine protease
VRNVNGKIAAYVVEVYDHGTPTENFKRGLLCYGPILITSDRWSHAIVLIGWDDAANTWLIKNSWGAGWEDHGFGKILYNANESDFLRYPYYYVDGVYNVSIH